MKILLDIFCKLSYVLDTFKFSSSFPWLNLGLFDKFFFNLEISEEIFMSRNIEIQLLQIIFLLSLSFNIPAPGEIT